MEQSVMWKFYYKDFETAGSAGGGGQNHNSPVVWDVNECFLYLNVSLLENKRPPLLVVG